MDEMKMKMKKRKLMIENYGSLVRESNLLVGIEHSRLGCLHGIDEICLMCVQLSQIPNLCRNTSLNIKEVVHGGCFENEKEQITKFLKIEVMYIHEKWIIAH